MTKNMQTLSAKQQAFVREYLLDLNATAAYKRAGYRGAGRSAENAASRMLGNVGVQSAIQSQLRQREELSTATLDRLESDLERIALSDVRLLFDEEGAMKPIAEWDADIAAAVASVECEDIFIGRGATRKLKGHARKIKFWDKVGAILALLRRRDLAAKCEMGSNDNPMHHRIEFIEFADVSDDQCAEMAP